MSSLRSSKTKIAVQPVNKSDFDKYMESAMTVAYETDENGEQVLDENGEPVKMRVISSW